jgi:hypothetical protein
MRGEIGHGENPEDPFTRSKSRKAFLFTVRKPALFCIFSTFNMVVFEAERQYSRTPCPIAIDS